MSWLAACGLFTSRCRECRAIFETICGWQVSCYVWILQSNTYRIKMASLEFWMTTTGNHGNSWNDDYLLCLKLWLEVVSVLWSQSEFCMNSYPAVNVNVRPGCSAPQRGAQHLISVKTDRILQQQKMDPILDLLFMDRFKRVTSENILKHNLK